MRRGCAGGRWRRAEAGVGSFARGVCGPFAGIQGLTSASEQSGSSASTKVAPGGQPAAWLASAKGSGSRSTLSFEPSSTAETSARSCAQRPHAPRRGALGREGARAGQGRGGGRSCEPARSCGERRRGRSKSVAAVSSCGCVRAQHQWRQSYPCGSPDHTPAAAPARRCWRPSRTWRLCLRPMEPTARGRGCVWDPWAPASRPCPGGAPRTPARAGPARRARACSEPTGPLIAVWILPPKKSCCWSEVRPLKCLGGWGEVLCPRGSLDLGLGCPQTQYMGTASDVNRTPLDPALRSVCLTQGGGCGATRRDNRLSKGRCGRRGLNICGDSWRGALFGPWHDARSPGLW
jgi:hypothetical protein